MPSWAWGIVGASVVLIAGALALVLGWAEIVKDYLANWGDSSQ